jgi:Protein of unknown function (DUF3307)
VIIQFIAWQIKHFICDFPLQNNYMLGKFKPFPFYILPLFQHSAVHAFGTAWLCALFNWPLWFIAFDLVTHFIIDRIKASPSLGGRWKPSDKYFWWALGADQMAHQLVGIFMIWWVFK